MKRKVWKWLLGISIAVLVLLVLFTLFLWAMFNACGALFMAMQGNLEFHAVSFAEFMSNFVGSPLFYIYLADLVVLLSSIVALIVTWKRKGNHIQEK